MRIRVKLRAAIPVSLMRASGRMAKPPSPLGADQIPTLRKSVLLRDALTHEVGPDKLLPVSISDTVKIKITFTNRLCPSH